MYSTMKSSSQSDNIRQINTTSKAAAMWCLVLVTISLLILAITPATHTVANQSMSCSRRRLGDGMPGNTLSNDFTGYTLDDSGMPCGRKQTGLSARESRPSGPCHSRKRSKEQRMRRDAASALTSTVSSGAIAYVNNTNQQNNKYWMNRMNPTFARTNTRREKQSFGKGKIDNDDIMTGSTGSASDYKKYINNKNQKNSWVNRVYPAYARTNTLREKIQGDSVGDDTLKSKLTEPIGYSGRLSKYTMFVN